jgi:hypothetical protein
LKDKNGIDLYQYDILGEYYHFDEVGWEYFKVTFWRNGDARYVFFLKGYSAANTIDTYS